MKTTPGLIEKKVEQCINAWETSCPDQSFADMTLEQFKQAVQPAEAAQAKFTAINVQWDLARQERNAAYAKALALTKGVANSVKGHPKYGDNSAVYAAMGYVSTSERSSGRTWKRSSGEAAKDAPVEPS